MSLPSKRMVLAAAAAESYAGWTDSWKWIRRNDTQVKVQGNRVELQEVERLAFACPGVASAAAVVGPHCDGWRTSSTLYSHG